MSDNNKKDPLERLFQKKAEDYDVRYNEADWLELEKRLNFRDKEYALLRKQRWLVAASILIFSLLAYFTYDNYTKINQISQQLNRQAVPGQQPNASDTDEPHEPNVSADTEAKSGRMTAGEHSGSRTTDSPALSSGNQTMNRTGSGLSEDEKRSGAGNRRSSDYPVTGNAGEELFVADLFCPTCTLSKASVHEEELSTLLQTDPPNTALSNTILLADASDNNAVIPAGSGSKFHGQNARFSIGIVMAPDLSTVGSVSDFQDPGYKAGVTVEYSLSSALNISTGIIRSKVRYVARGDEYNPPDGYWTDGITPYEAAAECVLIDIPLNLKYDFAQLDHSSFYATAGVSSYIMLNERYDFNYKGDDTGLIQNWSGHTGTRHWISNAGFSVGYELDLLPGWSLRAEPFIKIPLREVGWGNVRLYSVGSFISVNYKLGNIR